MRYRIVALLAGSAAAGVIFGGATAQAGPNILPRPPSPIVVWHCGPDVTTGRAVLVKHGRSYNVVVKGAQFASGHVVARCVAR
jgi:hypothetical protein